MKMTVRERLKRTFKCKEVDRMPVRIWGVDPLFPRDDWKVLYELTEKYELEIIRFWQPSSKEYPLQDKRTESFERHSEKEGLKEIISVIKTPKGNLTQIFMKPLDGSPGYVKKHFVENIEDAKKFLSLPENPLPEKINSYYELEGKTGERAMILIGIDHTMYSVQRLLGSELFGYWLYDENELLHEMMDKSFRYIEKLVKFYLSKNIGDGFGWVGPELCIPPLASVKHFEEFVFEYDRKIIELIHSENKLVWVHCHGDMKPVLNYFIKMEVDCLNPLEPPPVGKITLKEAKEICKGKMAIDGGIEDGAFDTLNPEEMKKLVEETIIQGKPGYGFILCPTSSPNTYAKLSPRHIENYRVFVETAVKMRNY